jgi:hypothetical protein
VQQPIDEVKTSPVSLNGLDEVFDVDTKVIDHGDQANSTVPFRTASGLNIREASQHYGLAIPTIRLKIKTGDIPAIKVNGPKGPEWRVFPDGAPEKPEQIDINLSSSNDQGGISDTEAFYEPDRSIAEGFHQANINVASLIKANQEMTAKLEAAVYRNGYLEAQIENERQQVKLLTDRLHTPLPLPVDLTLWAKFCSWFKA